MAEWRLFDEGTTPEHTTAAWYAGRDAAPHLEQEGHRQRLLLVADMITRNVPHDTPIIDLGSGDGGLLSLLDEYPDRVGYDLQQSNVDAAAARGQNVVLGDALTVDIPLHACVIVTEILEHLVDPHGLVQAIHDAGAQYLVASSPYNETNEAHYGFHTWAWDNAGYWQMIANAGWDVREHSHAWICQVIFARPQIAPVVVP